MLKAKVSLFFPRSESDVELVAEARMLTTDLSRIRRTLIERGLECDVSTWSDGRIEVSFERVTREAL